MTTVIERDQLFVGGRWRDPASAGGQGVDLFEVSGEAEPDVAVDQVGPPAEPGRPVEQLAQRPGPVAEHRHPDAAHVLVRDLEVRPGRQQRGS
ncbi:hypothetical protein [Pseudofrankia asymbiotica]|uniref:Uncharacterized protein n=1 Tax=Pseudofrankia asymbiotica TaxID=1834516 RepID=A0A1V2IAM3_9ACTN|nr:hypothetical protein [Pseudofrankia asymbiotica]ONH28695.1 hypothetical protein BL253_19190 [Pseudofrankia asymbiotica]